MSWVELPDKFSSFTYSSFIDYLLVIFFPATAFWWKLCACRVCKRLFKISLRLIGLPKASYSVAVVHQKPFSSPWSFHEWNHRLCSVFQCRLESGYFSIHFLLRHQRHSKLFRSGSLDDSCHNREFISSLDWTKQTLEWLHWELSCYATFDDVSSFVLISDTIWLKS